MASAASDSVRSTGTWPPSLALGILLQAEALQAGRQAAGERDGLRDLRLPPDLIPQLELRALADEHDTLVQSRVATQCGRHEDATGCIELHVISVADQQSLHAADAIVERRQAHQFDLDRLPGR